MAKELPACVRGMERTYVAKCTDADDSVKPRLLYSSFRRRYVAVECDARRTHRKSAVCVDVGCRQPRYISCHLSSFIEMVIARGLRVYTAMIQHAREVFVCGLVARFVCNHVWKIRPLQQAVDN